MGNRGNGDSSTQQDSALADLYQQEFTEELLGTPTIKYNITAVLLKPDVPFFVQAALGDQARWVNLVYDPDPPEAAIISLTRSIDVFTPQPEGQFVIKFSERIVPIAGDFGSQFCDSGMLPLSSEVSIHHMIAASSDCKSTEGKWDGAILLSGAAGGRAVFDKQSGQVAVYAYLK